jgi:hypothetical protein
MVAGWERFEAEFKGGYIYGVDEAGFREADDYGGEMIADTAIKTEFGIRVNSPRDLMEAGIQLFAIKDQWSAEDIAFNWREVVEQNAQA